MYHPKCSHALELVHSNRNLLSLSYHNAATVVAQSEEMRLKSALPVHPALSVQASPGVTKRSVSVARRSKDLLISTHYSSLCCREPLCFGGSRQ